MKSSNNMKTYLKPTLAVCAMMLAAGPAAAVDYYLAAKAFTKTMSDGSTVAMWGYVEDSGGVCYDTTPASDRLTCVNALPDPVAPGPRLTVPPGDNNLRIFLSNGLAESTSVVITGQEMPFSQTNNGPTWNDNTTGARGANLTRRVRSFGREAAANGGRQRYLWNNFRNTPFARPGTFIYHSGTHPQKQVYMGMYGAVTKDNGVGEAYPGVSYDNEVILFYSEIDPDLNTAIDAGTHTTSIHYHAKWFLVNGEPYVDGVTTDIDAGAVGANTLLRLLSTAGETHVPTLQGLYMTIHAEDGLQYNWQDAGTVMATAPRQQYSAMLPPLKTKDVIITAAAEGRYAVYDGNGYMTNPSDPNNFSVGDTVGGMLRFLSVGAAPAGSPVANDDPGFGTVEDTMLSEAAPGVFANDTAAGGGALPVTAQAVLVAGTGNGALTLNPDGSFDYTPNQDFDTSDSFVYKVVDNNLESGTATATITITAVNDAPVIVSTPVTTATEGEAYSYNVDATDVDTGDNLTYSLSIFPSGMTIDANSGVISWTPGAGDMGPNSVTADVADSALATASQSFTVTVSPVAAGTPPMALGDTYSLNEDASLDVAAPGVLANDTPTDSDPMTATLVSGPNCTNAFVLNADGSFHYEPISNWNSSLPAANPFCNGNTGADSFTYMAMDVDGNSNVVTVDITVNEMNDAPIATADTVFLTKMGTFTLSAPGLLDNDNDVDLIPFDPAQLTAVQETNPNRGTMNAFPGDGGFTYTFNNGRINTIATFNYHNNDGLANSNSVTVELRRDLSVKEATCEFEDGACDWRIQGRVSGLVPNGTPIEVWLGPFDTGTLIGIHTEQGGAAWSLNVNSGPVPSPGAADDVINVRAVTAVRPNAFITDYPYQGGP